ncbi:sensor histidine kinase [Salimicrobium halophilum]|uniref:histidine kinase n=1 Tax=Salimicrobium halophilum TaxID=86666 RepID=A0A1G8SUC7_9BACI|nr:HAMP domain-containing sensor histidine kinase [Salimicrobium halophilum]SDJ32375.1 Signal transduction histidine kinase [Salimicrobium halophilum]
MKLLHQLNAAFTGLILVVMTVTAIVLYSLIMDLFVMDEKRQLEMRAELLVDILNDPDRLLQSPEVSNLIQDQNYPLLLFDKSSEELLFYTLPRGAAVDWVKRYEEELAGSDIWDSGYGQYVITDQELRGDQVLVMATPLGDLAGVQMNFVWRMVLIFILGLLLAAAISYLFTRKLVTPLERLKKEVEKIEKRQFRDVQPVRATGEIKEVEQSVRQMAGELERYIRSQQQFFQNASHELKTPLMSIQGYAEGIKDGVFEGEKRDRGLTVMVEEIDRLKKIVNEMILLAKLDSNEDIYHPERLKVSEWTGRAADRLLPLAEEEGIEVNVDVKNDGYIQADPERFLQALMNIGRNGLRHASSNLSITVVKNGEFLIRIADDGDGIDEDVMPHLFERFQKGKNGETGLGLAISRAIVEKSGGSISAYNQEGSGAVFEITIPADE